MAREMTPDVFTVDYVGTPGARAFFLQIRSEDGIFTIALEKEQVGALAEKLGEMLLLIDRSDPLVGVEPARDPALDTEQVEPAWRVGAIGLGYEESSDMVAVLLEPYRAEEEESLEGVLERVLEEEPLQLMLRRDQARAFVLHALAVIGEGRPLCRLCGLPMDPEGHTCPASNGHKTTA